MRAYREHKFFYPSQPNTLPCFAGAQNYDRLINLIRQASWCTIDVSKGSRSGGTRGLLSWQYLRDRCAFSTCCINKIGT